MTIAIGAELPTFSAHTTTGATETQDTVRGQWTVIYFYPKDDTPGCTTEALEFTAHGETFATRNCRVLGVSADSVAKHHAFTDKHGLGVTLLSDPDKQMCHAFGAIVEKSMYGRKYMGIDRCTFLVDDAGIVRQLWRKVRAKGHATAVLAALEAAQQAAG